ncbi:MAG: glycoside hydrolase family 28 protein [Pirellulaceae bacterium]
MNRSGLCLIWLFMANFASMEASVITGGAVAGEVVFNVRQFGAVGDGKAIDTHAINGAVTACSEAGGGEVVLPAGAYLSGTVHLRSNVTLTLEADARLVGSPELAHYQQFHPPAGTFESRLGNWHRALILADGVENVTIRGPGVIDGNKVFDAQGEEHMRGPHTILIGRSKNVTLCDVSVVDSANYAIMLEWSDEVEVRNSTITGGWDGVHFRASRDDPCHDIRLVNCQFHTGDDSIAGRYVENLLVEGCVINSSCNGIRIIGPMNHMIVRKCRFYGPGIHPHRTSDRHNMLSGIILQPGAWDPAEGALEDVEISDVQMSNVASPVTIWLKRPGNTADNIRIDGLTATDVYRAAVSIESWTDTPVGRVTFRDLHVQYRGGGKAPAPSEQTGSPAVDARALSAWGLYAQNVEHLSFQNARWSLARGDQRPAMTFRQIKQLTLEQVSFPK